MIVAALPRKTAENEDGGSRTVFPDTVLLSKVTSVILTLPLPLLLLLGDFLTSCFPSSGEQWELERALVGRMRDE